MVFHLNDTVFLGAWAIVGSTLGYLAFRSSPENSPSERLKQCLLSVGLGLFLAFPLSGANVDATGIEKML